LKNLLHRRLLTHGELYFAPPSHINDPFDINIPLEFGPIDQEFTEVERLVSLLETGRDEPKIDRAREQFLRQREMAVAEMNDDIFGVFSASTRGDSLLMWSHYADNHTGFCVEINADEIAQRCHRHRAVRYHSKILELTLDRLSDPKQVKQTFSEFNFRKSKDWKYEDEYRFLLIDLDGLEPEDRLVTIPVQAVRRVILGLRVADAMKDEVMGLCRDLGIEVTMCRKVPNAFALGI